MNHDKHHHTHDHSEHLNPYTLGAAGVAGGVMAAPYLLPLASVGSYELTSAWAHILDGSAYFAEAGTPYFGTGLAGAISSFISQIPLVGAALTSSAEVTIPGLGWTVAAGTLTSIAAVAGLTITGLLASNWLQKHEDPDATIKWSKVVKYAALGTSAMIALPHILGAISLGVVSLAFAFGGNDLAGPAINAMHSSLGAPVMEHGATTGLTAVLLPHLLTCGSMIASVFAGLLASRNMEEKTSEKQSPTQSPPDASCNAAGCTHLRLMHAHVTHHHM